MAKFSSCKTKPAATRNRATPPNMTDRHKSARFNIFYGGVDALTDSADNYLKAAEPRARHIPMGTRYEAKAKSTTTRRTPLSSHQPAPNLAKPLLQRCFPRSFGHGLSISYKKSNNLISHASSKHAIFYVKSLWGRRSIDKSFFKPCTCDEFFPESPKSYCSVHARVVPGAGSTPIYC